MAAVTIIDDWGLLVILPLECLSAGWQWIIVCVHVGYIYMDDWLIIGYITFFNGIWLYLHNQHVRWLYLPNQHNSTRTLVIFTKPT